MDDNQLAAIVKRVENLSQDAAAVLKSLPAPVAEALVTNVPSPKLLVVGLLAAVRRTPTQVLARMFKIPDSWVEKHRDLCLRALRAKAGKS